MTRHSEEWPAQPVALGSIRLRTNQAEIPSLTWGLRQDQSLRGEVAGLVDLLGVWAGAAAATLSGGFCPGQGQRQSCPVWSISFCDNLTALQNNSSPSSPSRFFSRGGRVRIPSRPLCRIAPNVFPSFPFFSHLQIFKVLLIFKNVSIPK